MFSLDKESIITFINNISSGIIIVSSDYSVKFINNSALKTLLLERSNCMEKNIGSFIPDDLLIKSISNTLKNKTSLARLTTRLKLNNGNEITIGFTTSPYYSDNQDVSGVVINFRDISAEIALETRLKLSEHKYRLLIQNLQSPVILLKFDDFSIVEYNKSAFKKIKKLSMKKDNLTIFDAVEEESKNKLLDYISKIKNNLSLSEYIEIRTIDLENELRTLDFTAVLIEIENEKFIQSFCYDITEKVNLSHNLSESYQQLKDTQQTLIRAERLAASGELSAGISHEIKNRFQVIANAVSYIKTKIDLSNDALRINMAYIENEISRGVNLINQLMEFAKPHPPQKKKVALDSLLKNSIPLMQKQFQKKKINIVQNYSDIPEILIDYNLIQQVVVNILKNAEQAMNENGILSVKTYSIKSEAIHIINFGSSKVNKFAGYAVIEISDNGAGIEEINLSKIFTPFFTSKGPNEGTGLGLSVSHTIIEKHEGFIDVKSEPGKGSTFYIYLPKPD